MLDRDLFCAPSAQARVEGAGVRSVPGTSSGLTSADPAVPRIHRQERSIRGSRRVTALEAPWTRRGYTIIT
jgi:hypothetical protein